MRANWSSYDIQIAGGHYLNLATIGAGWVGYIKGAGFKGEVTYFQPGNNLFDEAETVITTVGFDYLLPAHCTWKVNYCRMAALKKGVYPWPLAFYLLLPQVTYSPGENLDLLVFFQLLKGNTFHKTLDTHNFFSLV